MGNVEKYIYSVFFKNEFLLSNFSCNNFSMILCYHTRPPLSYINLVYLELPSDSTKLRMESQHMQEYFRNAFLRHLDNSKCQNFLWCQPARCINNIHLSFSLSKEVQTQGKTHETPSFLIVSSPPPPPPPLKLGGGGGSCF